MNLAYTSLKECVIFNPQEINVEWMIKNNPFKSISTLVSNDNVSIKDKVIYENLIELISGHIDITYSFNDLLDVGDGNAFSVILGVDTKFMDKNLREILQINEVDSKKYTSLISRLFYTITEKWMDTISTGFAKRNTMIAFWDSDALINLAARDITVTCICTRYEILNLISVTPYEGKYCNGTMIFLSEKDMKNCLNKITRLKEEVYLEYTNRRQIRKLMEMSNSLTDNSNGNQNVIVSCYGRTFEDARIIGIANMQDFDDTTELYVVDFKGNNNWILSLRNQPLLEYGLEGFRDPNIKNNGDWSQRLNIYFGSRNNISDIVSELITVKHGGLLIIFEDENIARCESVRLYEKERAIKFEKDLSYDVTKSLIKNIASIDGAVIIDIYGKCYAFGCILDGEALVEGDKSRGARYNSANNYVQKFNNKSKVVACIVSEDGMIDIKYSNIGFR